MVFWFASSQELAARLQAGFQYGNNTDLCGAGLPALRPCTPADLIDPDRPQPFSAGIAPQVTAPGGGGHGRAPSTKALTAVVVVAVALLAATAAGLLALSWRRWRMRRVAGGSPPTVAGGRCSTETAAAKASSARKSASSALASLEYSNAWDPLADARGGGGGGAGLGFSSQDVLAQSLRISTEEVESATRYFSWHPMNPLRPSHTPAGRAPRAGVLSHRVPPVTYPAAEATAPAPQDSRP